MNTIIVSISDVIPSSLNAREQDIESKDSQRFIELCDSIKSDGLLEPLIVREIHPGKYEAIAGSRRLAALKHIGIKNAPVIVKEIDDTSVKISSLVENIHRMDLTEDEKQNMLESIYLGSWDEWKPKNWYEVMPRERDKATDEIKIYDCSTNEGKLVLARQFLRRIYGNQRIERGSDQEPKVRRDQEPTEAFKRIRERIGYAAITQRNILAGYGSIGKIKDYVDELPPVMREQFEKDERIRQLDEQRRRQLAKRIHLAIKPKRQKTRTQVANKVTEKFFNEPQQQKQRQQRPAIENPRESVKLEMNPVKARGEITILCLKLFKVLTGMDLDDGKLDDGEMQAKSIQAMNCMREISTFYIRDRELAALQCVIIPTNKVLSTFRDMVYESVETQNRKGNLSKP